MKFKKGYHLFFMLAVLIAHTFVLSVWLDNEQDPKKQVNFRIEDQKQEDSNKINLKTKFPNHKDSVKKDAPVFTANFNSHFK